MVPASRASLLQAAGGLFGGHTSRWFSTRLRITRRGRIFGSIGIAAYLAALLAGAPAALVLPRSLAAGASGTIWHGEAALTNGDRLRWEWSPLRSLAGFGFAADWQLLGRDDLLSGAAFLRTGSAVFSDVAGTTRAATLGVLAPDLPFACDFAMTVRLPRVVLGGERQMIAGSIRTGAGTCWAKGSAAATAVPPLAAKAATAGARGSIAWIAPRGGPRRDLVNVALSPAGKLNLAVTPAGAAMLPFASVSGGMAIETGL